MRPRLFDPAQGGPEVRHPTPKQVRRRKRLRCRVTCGEVVDRYLTHADKVSPFSPKSGKQIKSILAAFVKLHGPRSVSECHGYHLSDFVEGNPKWKASGTRCYVAAVINAPFNWATATGRLLSGNPFKGVRYSASEPKPQMPDDELARVCVQAPKPLERALKFLRMVGCRSGEMIAGRWEDMDLDKGLWTVEKHKTRKKTHKPKVKVLPAGAVELLREIGPQPFGPVFLNCHRRPWKNSGSFWCSMSQLQLKMKGLKRKYSPHAIRHRFITASVANGAPLKTVGAQVGHESIRTTERYIHMSDELDSVRIATDLAQPNGI